jgi:hypothetical protein
MSRSQLAGRTAIDIRARATTLPACSKATRTGSRRSPGGRQAISTSGSADSGQSRKAASTAVVAIRPTGSPRHWATPWAASRRFSAGQNCASAGSCCPEEPVPLRAIADLGLDRGSPNRRIKARLPVRAPRTSTPRCRARRLTFSSSAGACSPTATRAEWLEAEPPSPDERAAVRRCDTLPYRSDRKPARTSSQNRPGCSQAAKCPPFSTLL